MQKCMRGLEGVNLAEPEGGGCVGRHAPVTAGGEAYGAYFGAVGKAGAFELLVEKATEEYA